MRLSALQVSPERTTSRRRAIPKRLASHLRGWRGSRAWQQTQVDAGAFSGAVAAIARNGKVAYLRAVGFRDRAKTSPLQTDAIFWIASMTKPVTSVAAMMLVDEGKLDLAAPVSQYLPEFKDMMVGVETHGSGKRHRPGSTLEPQKRAMIVEDLLRHTSGLVYPDVGKRRSGSTRSAIREACARDSTLTGPRVPRRAAPAHPSAGRSLGLWSSASTCWHAWSRSPRASRSTSFLTTACSSRSAWSTPASGCRRRSFTAWSTRPRTLRMPVPTRDVTKPTTLFSGGGGLVSTAADYLRFCQMLLNGGELDGVAHPVARDREADDHERAAAGIRFAARCARLDLWTRLRRFRDDAAWSWVPGSVGSFSWSGVWGT